MPASTRRRAGPRILALALALTLTGALAAPAQATTNAPALAQRRFEAMTYNLYLGANLQPLFGTSGLELVQAAAEAWAHVQQVDFTERAPAIAAGIVDAGAEVVGLQEVSLWQTAPLSDPSSLTTEYDFLEILLDELAAMGHPYRVVEVGDTFVGAVPVSLTTMVRFTDRNAIIVRDDLPVSMLRTANPTNDVFDAGIPITIGGEPVEITRGWGTVDVAIRGKWYRFANTHLEAFHPVVRSLQAMELVGALADSPYPVVLVGDMNSLPTDLAGAYGIITGAGFVDAWIEAMDGTPGYTAGQSDDLDNVPSTIDHTVDYVFHDSDGVVDGIEGTGDIVGEELDDRTATGLWPSDHAAVVVTLRIAKP